VVGPSVALPEAGAVRYTVRVLLPCTPVGLASVGAAHSPHRARFVVLRDSVHKSLALPGGAWSAEADGGDPARDDAALIRTAMCVASHHTGALRGRARKEACVSMLMYVYMYVCMYVCMCVCMYACMSVWMCVCLYACLCVCLCVCVCMCLSLSRCVYVCASAFICAAVGVPLIL
jgi:hypothetical protein